VLQHIGHAMFSDINISQGTVVMPLRYSGICSDRFTANFQLNVTVKDYDNWTIFCKVMDKSLESCFFVTHGV